MLDDHPPSTISLVLTLSKNKEFVERCKPSFANQDIHQGELQYRIAGLPMSMGQWL
jgi:hypothetical protein